MELWPKDKEDLWSFLLNILRYKLGGWAETIERILIAES